jgi:hypothetical protein
VYIPNDGFEQAHHEQLWIRPREALHPPLSRRCSDSASSVGRGRNGFPYITHWLLEQEQQRRDDAQGAIGHISRHATRHEAARDRRPQPVAEQQRKE